MATSSADETPQQSEAGDILGKLADKWDPCSCKDWENEKPTQQCVLRIKRLLTTNNKYHNHFYTGKREKNKSLNHSKETIVPLL